jgi:hypothetical protein
MTRYAADTSVSIDRSKGEIERTLARYGAESFAYATEQHQAMIAFRLHGRMIRFMLKLPDPAAPEWTRTETGRPRRGNAASEAYQQAQRQCWRALALIIKAKLEAVEAGIVSLDQEFLGYTLLADGQTMAEAAEKLIEANYAKYGMPNLLPERV